MKIGGLKNGILGNFFGTYFLNPLSPFKIYKYVFGPSNHRFFRMAVQNKKRKIDGNFQVGWVGPASDQFALFFLLKNKHKLKAPELPKTPLKQI